MELGREHPDPGHPSSFALNLEEEEEEEENGDVMDVMNMEEEVCRGKHLGSGSKICSTQLAPGSNLPSSHPFAMLIIPPY